MSSFKVLFKDLFHAVVEQDIKKVQKIFFTNPNLLDESGSFYMVELLLLEAKKCDNEKIIKLLLKFIKLGGTNNSFINHLEIAMMECNILLIEILLKYGTFFEKKEPIGYDFLKRVHNKIFYKIYKIEERKKRTKLFNKIMRLLLEYKQLDTDIENNSEGNLLHIVCNYFEADEDDYLDIEIAEYLLNSGVQLDEVSEELYTPLIAAVRRNNKKLVSFLIKRGADVNKECETDEYGTEFPLLVAAQNCKGVDIVDILLFNGAKINAEDEHRSTALHEACYWCQEQTIDLLLRKGADISQENDFGRTPYYDLDMEDEDYHSCMRVMVKEFSKMTFENLPIHEDDMNKLKRYTNDYKFYENCLNELSQLAKIKFYGSYTYYFVLVSKKFKKLANLTRNKDFVKHFKDGLSFPCYNDDLQRILEEAIQMRDQLLTIESRLKFTFGHSCPDIVIRKLANSLTVEDLPQ